MKKEHGDTLISIIVPVYNAEKHLRQCIDSICNQTYQYFDLILVDDGSTDMSGAICDAYAEQDCRIRVIHLKNQGSLQARYRGLMATDTKYITFVDSDDWIETHMLMELMPIMVDNQMDFLISNAKAWREEEDYSSFFDKELKEGFYDRKKIETCLLPDMLWSKAKKAWKVNPSLYAKIFRTDLLKKIYDELKDFSFFYGDDVAVCYPYILRCNSLHIVQDSYYYYRLRKRGEVPPYYLNCSYFDDLYIVYRYLKNVFKNSDYSSILLDQLEHYYIWSVENRKRKYGEWGEEGQEYLFPFGKVERGSRIILYGAGKVGHQYFRQINQTSFCDIVMWVDKNAGMYSKEGVREVSDIIYEEFDYVVIALASRENILHVTEKLKGFGIGEKSIVY